MDFGLLSPEVNSGLLYTGPGSGPLMTAAAAWDGLAAQLHSAAASHNDILSALATEWCGPSSDQMSTAGAQHTVWLRTAAAGAEDTAARARTAAAAYETAFTATVPPPVVAANRVQLEALVATNIVGQNTPAIAMTEAQYTEMWAQDATTMYTYAHASTAAAQVTPFLSPTTTTSQEGIAGQTAATAHALATTSTSPTTLSQLTSTIPSALQSLAAPTQSVSPTATLGTILGDLGLTSPISFLTPTNTALTATSLSGSLAASGSATHADGAILAAQQQISDSETRILDRVDNPRPTTPLTTISASCGQASCIGTLSAPPAWTTQAPAIRLAATFAPSPLSDAIPPQFTPSPTSLFNQMSTAATAGQSAGTAASLRQWQRTNSTLGTRPQGESPLRHPLTELTAALRELAALRASNILTDGEFDRQKRRLLGE